MKTKETELTVVLLAIFGVLAVLAQSILWGGFWVGLTLSVLWGWFAAPLFGLPELTVWQAYGLALICFTLRKQSLKMSEDTFTDSIGKGLLVGQLLRPSCWELVGV